VEELAEYINMANLAVVPVVSTASTVDAAIAQQDKAADLKAAPFHALVTTFFKASVTRGKALAALVVALIDADVTTLPAWKQNDIVCQAFLVDILKAFPANEQKLLKVSQLEANKLFKAAYKKPTAAQKAAHDKQAKSRKTLMSNNVARPFNELRSALTKAATAGVGEQAGAAKTEKESPTKWEPIQKQMAAYCVACDIVGDMDKPSSVVLAANKLVQKAKDMLAAEFPKARIIQREESKYRMRVTIAKK
jgi:hypothetical protein